MTTPSGTTAKFENDHFGKRKLLSEEPDQPLYSANQDYGISGFEEDKLDKTHSIDKTKLS